MVRGFFFVLFLLQTPHFTSLDVFQKVKSTLNTSQLSKSVCDGGHKMHFKELKRIQWHQWLHPSQTPKGPLLIQYLGSRRDLLDSAEDPLTL